MTEQDFTAVVIDRLARIETGISNLDKKFDALESQADKHTDTLSAHEARLLLLESKQGGFTKVALPIITGLVATAAFVLTILDRFYN